MVRRSGRSGSRRSGRSKVRRSGSRKKASKPKPKKTKPKPRKQRKGSKKKVRAAAKGIQKVITKSEQKGKKKVNMSKYTKVIPRVEMDAEVPDFHKKPFKPPVVLPSKVKLNLKPISDIDMYKEFPYGD